MVRGVGKNPSLQTMFFFSFFDSKEDNCQPQTQRQPPEVVVTLLTQPLISPLSLCAGTIWETLSSDPSFSLLTAALNSTDLARALDGEGGGATRYTLFAPDNDAIRASSDFPRGIH